MADLSVNVAGVHFKNSVWLSSSEVTEGFERLKRGIDAGAAALIAKSYCAAYESGNEERRPFPISKFLFLGYDRKPAWGREVPKLFTNMGRSGAIQWCPVREDPWVEMLAKTQKYADKSDSVVIGSIFGSKVPSDMTRLARKMEQAGLKMLEVDLGCPNVEKMKEQGALLKSADDYFAVARAICGSVKIPVFIKLSPQQADLAATAIGVIESGAAGVTCHNRFLGVMVDIENGGPLMWGWSGNGGPWMLSVALGWVSRIREKLPTTPILGSSGAYDWEDVVRFHMAGANAVELCTTVMVNGYDIITETVDGVKNFMDKHGYKKIADMQGLMLKKALNYTQMYALPEYREKSFIDQDKCIHCGKCHNICWFSAIDKTPGNGIGPCAEACPAGIDSARYVQLIGQGKFDEAVAVVREKIPFPFVCGTACTHPCETACLRGHLEEPIAIMNLKRFAAEQDSGAWKSKAKKARPTGKKVAVVGSGPAGLTAGYYLAKLGHSVTVLESAPVAGGVMRTAIPDYRLPKDALDREIEGIKAVGVDIKTDMKVSSVDELTSQGFDAVFVATGAHASMPLGIPGERTAGVMNALTFLEKVKAGAKVKLGETVVVIGGGNSAIDASRTAIRSGAKDVKVLYRRSRNEMPANAEEVADAIKEGVEIEFLSAPTGISRNNSHLDIECVRMKLGEPDASGRARPIPVPGSEFKIEASTVIKAIGEKADGKFGVKASNDGFLATAKNGVFAGGDAVSGPSTIIKSIAAGRKAAIAIDKYLGGAGVIDEMLAPAKTQAKALDGDKLPEEHRPELPSLSVFKRITSFNEASGTLSKEAAMQEGQRCLHCDANSHYEVNWDYCVGCYNCKVVCPVKDCITFKPSPADKWPPKPRSEKYGL